MRIRQDMAIFDDYPIRVIRRNPSGTVTMKVDMPEYDGALVFDLMHDIEFGNRYAHLDGVIYQVVRYSRPSRSNTKWLIVAKPIGGDKYDKQYGV